MDDFSVAAFDQPVENPWARMAPKVRIQQHARDSAQRLDFKQARQDWQNLVNLAEVTGGKSTRSVGEHRHDVELAIRECQRHSDIVGGAVGLEFFEHREIEFSVVTLKAPPHTAHALENWRIRAFQILGPEQDIVRRFSFVDARLVVPPGEAGGKHLRVERANQQSETNHWQTLLNELRGKGVDEFRRRFVLPGIAEQPVDIEIVGHGPFRFTGQNRRVVFKPRVHPVPVEGNVVLYLGGFGVGLLIAPDRVFSAAIADIDGPVRGVALERTVGVIVCLIQQIHAHIVARKIERRRQPGFFQDHGRIAVGDGYAVELDTHAREAARKADLVGARRCVTHFITPGEYRSCIWSFVAKPT